LDACGVSTRDIGTRAKRWRSFLEPTCADLGQLLACGKASRLCADSMHEPKRRNDELARSVFAQVQADAARGMPKQRIGRCFSGWRAGCKPVPAERLKGKECRMRGRMSFVAAERLTAELRKRLAKTHNPLTGLKHADVGPRESLGAKALRRAQIAAALHMTAAANARINGGSASRDQTDARSEKP